MPFLSFGAIVSSILVDRKWYGINYFMFSHKSIYIYIYITELLKI